MYISCNIRIVRFFGRRTMMKNVLIVLTVLAMASVANAAMMISVNGVIDPPDSTITLRPSEIAVIDIHGNGATPPNAFFLGVSVRNMGLLSVDKAVVLYTGNKAAIYMEDNPDDVATPLGIDNPFVHLELTDVSTNPPPLTGLLANLIEFHCTGQPGDVLLKLFDVDGNLMDSQIIHQIPEPITFALLGLGGLFLRRRK